jgi:hypothetical protein
MLHQKMKRLDEDQKDGMFQDLRDLRKGNKIKKGKKDAEEGFKLRLRLETQRMILTTFLMQFPH